MKHPITISEITKAPDCNCPLLINNQIKITNTSDQFINNIKLTIHDQQLSIFEESIIRQRGALSFNPQTHCLELGNLAPNESAYFEYKFFSPSSLSSLSDHFFISYTAEDKHSVKEKKIVEYLSTTSSIAKD